MITLVFKYKCGLIRIDRANGQPYATLPVAIDIVTCGDFLNVDNLYHRVLAEW
jgi:hypothetical protein